MIETDTLTNIDYMINSLCADELSWLKNMIDNTIINTVESADALHNIIKRERKNIMNCCPHCGSTHFVKNGRTKKKVQKYMCRDCNVSFSDTTNSITHSSKKPYKVWAQFIECMVAGYSLKDISGLLDISTTTAFNWRHKIMEAMGKYENNAILSGELEIDETYFLLNMKGTRTDLPRKSKKRGTSAIKRGISNEYVCVLVAIDENDKLFSNVIGQGNPESANIQLGIKNKIKKGSTIVTDSKTAYIKPFEQLNCKLYQIPSGFHTIGKYNLGAINGIHSEMHTWFKKFRGVSTKHLQKYLNWFRFEKKLKYQYEIKDRNRKSLVYSISEYTKLIIKDISNTPFPIDVVIPYS